MPFPSGKTIYTCLSITFTREAAGGEVVPWFYPDPAMTKDPVLGGSQVYLDKGALVYPPLVFRASCLSSSDRTVLINALWTTTTLSNSRGHTGTVTITKATPINQGSYQQWLLDVGFELRP